MYEIPPTAVRAVRATLRESDSLRVALTARKTRAEGNESGISAAVASLVDGERDCGHAA